MLDERTDKEKMISIHLAHKRDAENVVAYHKEQVEKYQKIIDDRTTKIIELSDSE